MSLSIKYKMYLVGAAVVATNECRASTLPNNKLYMFSSVISSTKHPQLQSVTIEKSICTLSCKIVRYLSAETLSILNFITVLVLLNLINRVYIICVGVR